MKQTLQLKLGQQLTLTPQLRQSIHLLQLSTFELQQEIHATLEVNPLLELADDAGTDEASVSDLPDATEDSANADDRALDEAPQDWDTLTTGTATHTEDDERDHDGGQAVLPTLQDHLLAQVRLLTLSQRDKAFLTILINELDEDGYLSASLDEILDSLPDEIEADPDELLIARQHLQQLEPTGVGARGLSECMQLQLQALPATTPGLALAQAIVATQLDLLASRDFTRLKKQHGCTDAELKQAQQLITRLNPRPGAMFNHDAASYIVPDVVVRKVRQRWVVSLNQRAMPNVRVNALYASILGQERERGQMAQQLQEARWFIKNIEARFATILKVSQAIVARQQPFLEYGDIAMKPLVLREIADEVGMHESTISRVTTQKYMLTPRGVLELKYFFGSHVETEGGGGCSATAVKALIRQLISDESKARPLSDNTLATLLEQQGIPVARRTVAKYREAMNIPPALQRKEL
jgi:RNA polymerase sigma-54 factor